MKAAFLYNFFKFIEWPPASASQKDYSLCATGNDQLGDSLLVLENKTIGSKSLVIRRSLNGNALKECDMVFISSSENAAAILRDLKGLPVVTVSDKPDFVDQGGMIGLVMVQDDSRLGFEINLATAQAADIHISSQLLKLAKRVYTSK